MYECPPRALANVVQAIWEVDGTVVNTRERILPGGSIDVLVNLGPEQRVIGAAPAVLTLGGACLSGVHRAPLLVESNPRVHMFGVRLRPAAAFQMLAVPMGVASGRVIPLDTLRRDAGVALRDACAGATTFEERVGAVCRWIENRCGGLRRTSHYAEWMTARLECTGGLASIDELRRAAGVSRKKLAADFRDRIGVTPKVLARILRVRRACIMLQRGAASLADAAAACGYFDQSHMAREFRDIGDVTPHEFLVSAYPDGNSVIG